MSRIGLFLALTAVFCTINCSDNPVDDAPPVIVATQQTLYNVYDTVVVQFTEDLKTFTAENYVTTPGDSISCSLDTLFHSKVNCISQRVHYLTTTVFSPDTNFAEFFPDTSYSIQFVAISDYNDNVAGTYDFTFSTTSMADHDSPLVADVNGGLFNAVPLNTEAATTKPEHFFYNGTPIDSGITLSGIVEFGVNGNFNDLVDGYVVRLRSYDSLEIVVDNITEDVELLFKSNSLDSILIDQELEAGRTYIFDVFIDITWHGALVTTGDIWERSDFLLQIILANTNLLTPYTLKIRRKSYNTNPAWPQ